MLENSPSNLESSLTDLKFRVLTIGRSGAGKTSLIKETFKIDSIQASDKDPGKCNIEDELYSEHNKYFILHDSQGFEPGETENYAKVQRFLDKRLSEDRDIKDRLHAVWLCIRIPKAGGRLIEAAEEMLFRLDFGDVPVIIVFTQYDGLRTYLHFTLVQQSSFKAMNAEERGKKLDSVTEKYFGDECVERLKKLDERSKKLKWVKVSTNPEYSYTLDTLTTLTEKLVSPYISKGVYEAGARAQRVNVNWKIKASVEVGFKKYWLGLASGAHFAGKDLKYCFDAIHRDVVDLWNFRDEDQLLHDTTFKAQMIDLIQDLTRSAAEPPDPNSQVVATLENIKKALDVVTPLGGPAAPIVAGVGLGVAFTKWLLGTYSSTPETIRAFMGYIVNLTLTLESLFWITSAQPKPRQITTDDVDAAYGHYSHSDRRSSVHREIRLFVDRLNFVDVMNQDQSHLEVERLIEAYRHDSIHGNDLKNSPVAQQLLTSNASGSVTATDEVGNSKVKPSMSSQIFPTYEVIHQDLSQTSAKQKTKRGGLFKIFGKKKE